MNSTTILGFFYAIDLYSQSTLDENYGTGTYTSNQKELFYMNLRWPYPAKAPDHPEMKRTLTHEFQHMVNFGYRATNQLSIMETWIDEGLAESSEHYVLETPGTSRINWFNSDPYNNLRNGLSLLVWERKYGNYSLSYTFIQYLRIQSGLGTDIYKQIVTSKFHNYKIIESVIAASNPKLTSFDTILKSYRLANLLQQNSDLFGYGDENTIFNLTVQPPTVDASDITLKPGGSIILEGPWNVISPLNGAGKGAHIEVSKVQDGYVQEL